jgi:protein-disulfide isomerase
MNRKNVTTIVVFSGLGAVSAAFLTYQHARLGLAPLCGVGSGCYTVLSHPFFSPNGIFLGWIGLSANLAFLLAGAAMWFKEAPATYRTCLDYAALATVLSSSVLLGAEFLLAKQFCLSSVLCGLFAFAIWRQMGKLKQRSQETIGSPGVPRAIVMVSAFVLVLFTALTVAWLAIQLHGEPGVVATVGLERITTDEMRQSPLVFQAERRLYEAEHDWLSQRMEQALLRREALARGVSMDHLVEENRSAAQNDASRAAFFQQLADKYGARTYLDAPAAPIFHVDTRSAARLGPANAPVTIVEFGDLQCPFTARASQTVNTLVKEYGSDVSIAAMDFPLPFHAQAMPAAIAARCASQQGKFWEYRDRLFADQKNMTEEVLQHDAAALGLDLIAFRSCERSQAMENLVNASRQEGIRLGLSSTPTFFINGQMLSGSQPIEEFRTLIEKELHAKR